MSRLIVGYFRESDQQLIQVTEKLFPHAEQLGDSGRNYEVISGSFPGSLLIGNKILPSQRLSQVGFRSMSTEGGRLTIIFDGKIYNRGEIQRQLEHEGYAFRTDTDAEAALKAFDKWGAGCLPRLIGLFAFCIYDNRTQKLFMVRDPFGIKPLFFAQENGKFAVSSEIRFIIPFFTEKPRPDFHAAYHYLVHGDYDSSERTFFEKINHLAPGSYMSFDLNKQSLSGSTSWWVPKSDYEQNLPFSEAAKLVREQLLENIKFHLTGNEPVGVALSGGLDSSAILCAVRHFKPEALIHTFSYVARDTEKSEESWIDFINSYTKSIPYKVVVTYEELMDDLDDLIKTQGEPFGSTNIYAQYRVFKLANQNGIRVLLDGQGADGILGGQNGYPGFRMLSLLENRQFLTLLRFANNWAKWPGRGYRQAWMYFKKEILPDHSYKIARKILGRDFEPAWLNMAIFRNAGVIPKEHRYMKVKLSSGRRVVEKLALSLHNRGLQHLLRHGDRNAHRFGIDDRPVFLTTQMSELLYSFPENYLISNDGQTKSVFREAMKGIVPDLILDRKDKVGFETPEKEWKGFLADRIETNLRHNPNELIIKTEFKRKSGNFSSAQLWRILNYLEWLKLYQPILE